MVDTHDIVLIWNPNTEIDLDFYRVKRGTSPGGPYTLVGEPKQHYFTDKDISVGTYYYIITAVDKEGNESTPSSEITKTSPADTTAPTTPTGLKARRVEDYSGVELFWNRNPETDVKGYIVYRTYNGVDYHIATLVAKNAYTDKDIPRDQDLDYRATYVAYAVAAYDESLNISTSAGPTDFFIIPTLRNIKVNTDFLSLNVSWRTPLPEDNVEAVGVFYKKKDDVGWIYAGMVEYPTSSFRIEGPLDRNTEYDVALALNVSQVYPIKFAFPPTDLFFIAGEHANQFPVDFLLLVFGSTGNDGAYTIKTSTDIAGDTQIETYEAIPDSTSDGSLYSAVFQVPTPRVVIPDYDQDTTPPTIPFLVNAKRDPENDRVYLSWFRQLIDNDFYSYEVSIYDEGSTFYILHGKTSDNNYTINNVSFYKTTTDRIYVKVRAVDRTGNLSGEVGLTVFWVSDDITGLPPQWMVYTEQGRTAYKDANMRDYELTWNDASELLQYFRDYVLYLVQEAPDTPTDVPADHFDLDAEEILLMAPFNTFTLHMKQVSGQNIYIWPAVRDWFGAIYAGPTTSILVIPPT